MDIEILISTLNDGLKRITSLPEGFSFLIVHQITDGTEAHHKTHFHKTLERPNVRYIQMFEPGLSKSRNLALKQSKGDLLWIMDDDVTILPSARESLLSAFKQSQAILVAGLHGAPPHARKGAVKAISILSAARISSIDICIHRDALKLGVRFDEDFGLGTRLPSGEEYIFLVDILKNGGSAVKLYQQLSLHPQESSGADFFSHPNKVEAKRKMFIRALGALKGEAFFVLFTAKKALMLIKHKKFWQYIKYAYLATP